MCLCNREKRYRKQHFDLLTAVHEAEYSNVKRPIDPETKRPLEPAHKFEVTTDTDSISQAKYVSSPKFHTVTAAHQIHRYELFLKYQTTVHKEPASRWKNADFKRFLCSGLKRTTVKEDGKEKRLGSWHQCYRLDGKLIAVAVLDLLPHGVSSVYI